MKKSLLFSLLLIAGYSLSLVAQPTITNSSIIKATTAGAFVVLGQADTLPGPSGANVTWDFSNIPDEAGTPFSAIANSASKNGGQFTTADVANEQPMDAGAYFSTSNNKMAISGLITANKITIDDYDTDPKELLVTPITYNDVFNETFSGTQVNTVGNFTYDRGGTIRIEADGYGTLILPNITINNVLRVYVKIDYTDKLNGITVGNYTEERYEWYHQSVEGPILSITSLDGFGLKTFVSSYRRVNAVGVDENDASNSFKVYPNPSNGIFNLTLNERMSANASISVYDMRGQLIIQKEHVDTNSNNFTEIDLSTYSKGVYYVYFKSDNQLHKEKIVLQ